MKLLFKLRLFPFLLFALTPWYSTAQEVQDAIVRLSPLPGIDTLQEAAFVVVVSDTLNILEIEVVLSEGNGAQMRNHRFVFDQMTGLPTGFTYTRSLHRITMEVGQVPVTSTYLGKVRLKKSNNSWTDPYNFIFN